MVYWYNQGLGGNWFMKKTETKKSRDTVPLRDSLWVRAEGFYKFLCVSYC